jgi:hypothetical protein
MVVPARFTKADSSAVIRNVTTNMLYAVVTSLLKETFLGELPYEGCFLFRLLLRLLAVQVHLVGSGSDTCKDYK